MKKITWALSALFCAAAMLLVPASLQAATFRDVPEDAWYAPYVNEMADQGILNGRGDGTFDPNGNITRAEMVKILASASGEDLDTVEEAPFQDCSNHWAKKYINWAYKTKVVNGVGDNIFMPDGNVSRMQFAAMICRYAEYKKLKITRQHYKNAFLDDIHADWSMEYIYYAQEAGILNGYPDETVRPHKSVTRGEAAKIFINGITELPPAFDKYVEEYKGSLRYEGVYVKDDMIITTGNTLSLKTFASTEQPGKYGLTFRVKTPGNIEESFTILFEEGVTRYFTNSTLSSGNPGGEYQVDIDFTPNGIFLHITRLSGKNTALTNDTIYFAIVEDDHQKPNRGVCGGELYWKIEGDTLHIFGNGPMTDWDDYYKNPPWGNGAGCRYIVIDEGCTSIGINAFSFFNDLEEVYLPLSLQFINRDAFDITPFYSIFYNGTEDQFFSIGIHAEAFQSDNCEIYVWEE